MNSNRELEEQTVVCAMCGHLVTVPTAQLSDYYHGQRWFAALGLAIVLVHLAFALA
ncbi:hypothetical protein J7E62_15095 [Variovorax paradoxus]|nr:hypothetical protein [Variovorax paradoxus]